MMSGTEKVDALIDNVPSRKAFELALLLALGNMVDAISIMNVGFILAELPDQSRESKEFLSSAVFIGMLLGGIVCGYFADKVGRKPCLVTCLGINFVACVLSSLAPDVNWLMAFLLLGGLGIGGSVPIVFSLGAELFPGNIRGKLISLIASFWMVGAIFSSICAWIMLGYDFNGDKIMFNTTWRGFAGVSSIPVFATVVLTSLYVPESIRYLISKGRYDDAALMFKQYAGLHVTVEDLTPAALLGGNRSNVSLINSGSSSSRNSNSSNCSSSRNSSSSSSSSSILTNSNSIDGGSIELTQGNYRSIPANSNENSYDSFQCGVDDQFETISFSSYHGEHELNSGNDLNTNTNTNRFLSHDNNSITCPNYRLLMSSEWGKTVLTFCVIWFSLCFGTYGLSTWIAVLFQDLGMRNPYFDTFIFALANLPGNLVSIFYIDLIGRKRMLAGGMGLACLCAIGFASNTSNEVVVVICASLFNAFSVAGWNSLDCLSAETFPTAIRTSSMGLLSAAGRFGAIVAQIVNSRLENDVSSLLGVTGFFMLVGSALALILPAETFGSALMSDDDPKYLTGSGSNSNNNSSISSSCGSSSNNSSIHNPTNPLHIRPKRNDFLEASNIS